MPEVIEIACDEAGHTGPDLLSKDQRHFSFSSVCIGDAEAFDIIARARTNNPVQMPELKSSTLLKSEKGKRLISEIILACEGRYTFLVHDKLLALCGWLFEYIYEPVYQKDPWFLYDKNLHRFIAMFTWMWMNGASSEARQAVEQFQKYMRSRNPRDAPFFFDTKRSDLSEDGKEHPFESVLRFAYGYRDVIVADNANLDKHTADGGRWVLDLSISALWSHLNYWGRKGKPLVVTCDESKPLRAQAEQFKGDETDAGIKRARDKGYTGPLGWKLSEPIAYGDSRNHPAIQLADVIAGAVTSIVNNGVSQGLDAVAESFDRHGLPDCIMPDLSLVDLKNRETAVNALVMYDLAKRAERRGDPYENLRELYKLAEVSWVRGDFALKEGSKRQQKS